MSVPLVLIAAVGRNGAIGSRNRLPWRLPSDLRHFRAVTWGKPVLMGRRTFDSIGRPLPGRFVVVVSRDPGYAVPDGVVLARGLDGGVERGRELAWKHGAGEVMVAGGATLYRDLIAAADRLHLTEVDLAPAADAFFPAVDTAVWQETRREPGPAGPGDDASFTFVDYARG